MSHHYSYGQPQVDPRTGQPLPAQQPAPPQHIAPPRHGGMFPEADGVETEYYHGGYGTTAAQQNAEFYGAPQPVVDVDPRTGIYGTQPVSVPQQGTQPVSVPQQGTPPASAAPHPGTPAAYPNAAQPPQTAPQHGTVYSAQPAPPAAGYPPHSAPPAAGYPPHSAPPAGGYPPHSAPPAGGYPPHSTPPAAGALGTGYPPQPPPGAHAAPVSSPSGAARSAVASARVSFGAPAPTPGGQRAGSAIPATGVRPPTLRAGRHNARAARLGQLVLPRGQAGLVLGRDQDGQAVAIRPFQRDGVRLALLGGLWAARIVVFRTLALGARVVVHTERADDWRGLGRWAIGRDDRLTVLESTQPVLVPATAATPALTVHDFGSHGNLAAANPGPYRADLTVLSEVNAAGFMALEQADVVLAQRLTAAEAYAAQSVRRFPESTVDMLQRLGDDMLAIIGDGPDGYLWTTPTPPELQAFGPVAAR